MRDLSFLDGCQFLWGTGCAVRAFLMQSGLEQVVDGGDNVVSFQSELPLALQQAMVQFIERHPNWDQYRLVQAALAGFLVQNGIESREITRVYVGNMFRRESLLHGA